MVQFPPPRPAKSNRFSGSPANAVRIHTEPCAHLRRTLWAFASNPVYKYTAVSGIDGTFQHFFSGELTPHFAIEHRPDTSAGLIASRMRFCHPRRWTP